MTEVLVVDDSQFMRSVLATVLREHGFEVRTASDGETAIETAVEHEPDVITMDVQMPGVDGIEAVERIMARQPTPILMLSAHTREGADATLDALSHGAIDVLPKPGGEISADIDAIEDDLVETVAAVADSETGSLTWERAASAARTAADAEAAVREASESVARHTDAPATPPPSTGGTDGEIPTERSTAAEPLDATGTAVPATLQASPTIVVGASTGGPRIVEQLLAELPLELDARVLVVQHMPSSFTDRLARRVDEVSDYDVREASNGARVRDGEVLVAKGGYHLRVTYAGEEHLRVRLDEDEPIHGVRPSIDATMSSAAREVDGPLVGVALSGMGRDGADGIAAVADAGGATVAQDEDSSPVYGIPRHAVETGAVDRICAADDLVDGVVASVTELASSRAEGDDASDDSDAGRGGAVGDRSAATDRTATDGGERSDGSRSTSEPRSDGDERADSAQSTSDLRSEGGEPR